jgi:hypothetical protein
LTLAIATGLLPPKKEVLLYLILIIFFFHFQFPKTEEEWKCIAKDFDDKWNFPHCLGAVDGKHIQIIPPVNSGSYYYNYKGHHHRRYCIL